MALKVKMLTLGMISTNCFVIGDEETKDAIVIDPADDAPAIMKSVEEAGWTVRKILATHAHFDHILAARDLKERTGAPFLLHRDDLPLLDNMQGRVKAFFGFDVPPPPKPDGFVGEGDVIEVGGVRLEVLFTPGHAPGHVTYVTEADLVFSGDCLFQGSIGRTDLPGGDYHTLMTSIADKLMPLDDGVTVAPGHGPLTTIGAERASNPFVLDWFSKRGEAAS
jgi:glyoxylase-like metal-dependent hydrolase (beta-lactamase superfamily II)